MKADAKIGGDGRMSDDQMSGTALARQVPFLLFQAGELASHLGDQALAPLGLTARQFGILSALLDGEAQSQQALAERLAIDRTTMVALIDELEGRGWVTRRRDPLDRRRYALTLTPPGRTLQAEAETVMLSCGVTFLAPLPAADQHHLFRLLTRLLPETEPQP